LVKLDILLGVVRIKDRDGVQTTDSQRDSPWLETLLEMIKSMKYGSVTIIVQDGVVVQIDKNEKFRFNSKNLKLNI